jgi:hypothetical protein
MNLLRVDFYTVSTALNRLRALEGTGVDTVIINWPNSCPYAYGWNGRDEYDYRPMELHLEGLLNEYPDLKFILSFGAQHGTPYYWSKDNPQELAEYHLGKPMQQASLGSKKWLKDSGEAATRFAKHFSSGPFAGSIVGCFMYQTGVDWYGVGECPVNIPEHEIPEGTEYPVEGDFSQPMLAAFREYLKAKYGDDASLQAAWRNNQVQLSTARLPSRIEVRSPLPHVQDYFACYNDLNAKQAIAWAKALKAGAAGWQIILPHGHIFAWPLENLTVQGSGHNSLDLLLQSEVIDGLVAPASLVREQAAPQVRHPIAALAKAGKQSIHSLDCLSLTEISVEGQLREMTLGFAYAELSGAKVTLSEVRQGRGSMYDAREVFNILPYDEPSVRQRIQALWQWQASRTPMAEFPQAEVAVFYSPKANYQRGLDKRHVQARVEGFRNDVLPLLGCPYEEHLLSDFDQVADRYRAWIFVDCSDMSEAVWDRVASEPQRAFTLPLDSTQAEGPTGVTQVQDFLKTAGCHLWVQGAVRLMAGRGVLCLYGLPTTEVTVELPEGLGSQKGLRAVGVLDGAEVPLQAGKLSLKAEKDGDVILLELTTNA